MNIENNNNLYVLSITDLMDMLNISKNEAEKYAENFPHFYINKKLYISAEEYFGEKYVIEDIIEFDDIEKNNSKIIKILPKAYSINDISIIFNCSKKQAANIIKNIPSHFKLNKKYYVMNYDFNEWINSLKN